MKRISAKTVTLAHVRDICLALPEAHEKEAWGAPTFRVRDKQFAMYVDNHHNDGQLVLWCNATHDVQESLVEADPERFFVPALRWAARLGGRASG